MAQMAEKDKVSPEESGFLARWSRRKRQAAFRDGEPLHEGKETEPLVDVPAAEPEESEEEKANREAAESVDIDSLTYESDFSIFMKSGVPEFLRRKAMRKLWTSNPVLANLDGLNDYDEDYADPKFNVFKSAWNVVGGYLGESKTQSRKDEALFAEGPPNANVGGETDKYGADAQSGDEDSAHETMAETVSQSENGADEDDSTRDDPVPRISLRQRLKG
jgi:hypothetical protein